MSALLYVLLVSGLATLAALAAERVFTALRLPTRWIWISAMAGTSLVAVGVWTGAISSSPDAASGIVELSGDLAVLSPEAVPDERSFGEAVLGAFGSVARAPAGWANDGLTVLRDAAASVGLPSGLARLGAGMWLLLSAGLAAAWLLAWRRLARRREGWPSARLLTHPVRVSDGLGPAVVGLRRPEIVLPDRMLGLPDPQLGLVLRHEREHLYAGDTRLLAAGLVPLIVFPWNPFLWIQSRRLRMAVEIDCDTRVLRSGVSPRTYARTLIEAGADRFPGLTPAPALTGPKHQLERRIRTMRPITRLQRIPVALAGALLAVAFVALACEVDTPTAEPLDDADRPDAASVDLSASVELDTPPLIFVDGVITSREFLDGDGADALSAERIESIEVIKGDAALEQYGERAAAGVILLTTKDAPAPPEPAGTLQLREVPAEDTPLPPEIEISPPPPSEYEEVRVHEAGEVSGFEVGAVRRDGQQFEVGRVNGARILLRGNELSSTVQMRGRSGSTDGPSPLIIVDGVIQTSGAIDIPPEQIESVEVVKGAAASELYGSRAEHGIIQITTKKPDGDGDGQR